MRMALVLVASLALLLGGYVQCERIGIANHRSFLVRELSECAREEQECLLEAQAVGKDDPSQAMALTTRARALANEQRSLRTLIRELDGLGP